MRLAVLLSYWGIAIFLHAVEPPPGLSEVPQPNCPLAKANQNLSPSKQLPEFIAQHLPVGIPRNEFHLQLAADVYRTLREFQHGHRPINDHTALGIIRNFDPENKIPYHTKSAIANGVTAWAARNGMMPRYHRLDPALVEKGIKLGLDLESLAVARDSKRLPELERSLDAMGNLLNSDRLWNIIKGGNFDYLKDDIYSARRRFYRELNANGLGPLHPFDRALLFSNLRGSLSLPDSPSKIQNDLADFKLILSTNIMQQLGRNYRRPTEKHSDSNRGENPVDEGDAREQLARMGVEIKASGDDVYTHLGIYNPQMPEASHKGGSDVAADVIAYHPAGQFHIVAEVKPNATESPRNLARSLLQLETSGDYLKAKEGADIRIMNLLFVHDVGKRDTHGRMPVTDNFFEKDGILHRQDGSRILIHGSSVSIVKLTRK